MKIRKVKENNHARVFCIEAFSGSRFEFPYAKASPEPTRDDRITELFVDKECDREAFTYVLASGAQGTIHLDQVREHTEDPEYLTELLIYRLTLEAQRCFDDAGMSQRQIARQLKTSVSQLQRLMDPANAAKSMKQLIELLHLLGCEVDLVVHRNDAA